MTPLMVTTGCRKQTPVTTPGAPVAQQATPEYRLTQSLAILVESNKAVTQVVIQLNAAKTLSNVDTEMILNYNSMVAQSAKAALVAMDNNRPFSEKVATVKAAFAAVQKQDIVKAFIDANRANPKYQALVQTVSAMELVLTNLVGSK